MSYYKYHKSWLSLCAVAVMMDALFTSETSIIFYESTRLNMKEGLLKREKIHVEEAG
jgi:hypothetical protein